MSERGWAKRELDRVAAEMKTWPKWMRETAQPRPKITVKRCSERCWHTGHCDGTCND